MCQLKLSRPLTVCKYETKKKRKTVKLSKSYSRSLNYINNTLYEKGVQKIAKRIHITYCLDKICKSNFYKNISNITYLCFVIISNANELMKY